MRRMFSAGPDGAWSQEAGHAQTAMVVGGRIASHPVTTKEKRALRKKDERANTTALWATLALLAPNVDENKAHPGNRSKALRGRAKDELLKDVIHAVRLAQELRSHDLALDESERTPAREPFPLSNQPPTPAPTAVALMGVVFWRRADGSSDYTDTHADDAGSVGASLHHTGGCRADGHRVEERQDRTPEPVLPAPYRSNPKP